MLIMLLLTLMMLFEGGLSQPRPGDCYCVDDSGNNVTVSQMGCTDVYRSHSVGACFQTTGDEKTCSLDKTVYEIGYGPQNMWVSSEHLERSNEVRCGGIGGDCSRLEFVPRAGWGAREPVTETPIQPAFSGVFVHHSAMDRCFTNQECILETQEIQNLHMDTNGWDDVGYHFLVGEDGRVYEGRGWDNRGAHARMHNEWTYGICVMGDFVEDLPNEAALTALRDLMDCGVQLDFPNEAALTGLLCNFKHLVTVNEAALTALRDFMGKITSGFEIFGHRDGVCTECPGQTLYDEIQTWAYFSYRDIPVDC